MPAFYAFAYTTKGEEVFIPLNETVRHEAVRTLKEFCKKEKLNNEKVYVVQGTQRQAGTLLKQFGDKTPTPRKKGRGKR